LSTLSTLVGKVYIFALGTLVRLKLKWRILLSVLLLVLVTSTSIQNQCVAQDRSTGVSAGNWFRYASFVSNVNTNDPNATFRPLGTEALVEINETAWLLMSIQNISSTTVSLAMTTHFRNGTEVVDSGYVNIDVGSGNMPFKIVASNLNVNDSVYTMHSEDKISSMYNSTYPTDVRQTVYMVKEMTLNVTRLNSIALNGTYHESATFGWDRATGALVRYSFQATENISDYTSNWSYSYEVADSNVWIVPEYSTWILVIATAIVTASYILVLKRTSLPSRIFKANIHHRKRSKPS
jgi:hypothetical protein